jgi:transcriptional regulator with XRE-family HTH domain
MVLILSKLTNLYNIMSYNYKPVTELHLKIRFLRERSGANQTELANFLGISQRAYSKIERNETDMRIEHLMAIATFYTLSVTDLFTQGEQELLLMILQQKNS